MFFFRVARPYTTLPLGTATPAISAQWQRVDLFSRLAAIAALSVFTASVWHTDANDSESAERARAEQHENSATQLTPPEAEWLVAGYGGAPYTYPSTVSLKKAGQHDFSVNKVDWKGEPFIDPIYYGVRIARWFGEGRTGAMLDFTHSKTKAILDRNAAFSGILNGEKAPQEAELGKVFRRLEFSHGHNMLTLNGLLRLADLHPRLSPYVGIGGGINLPHSEIQLRKGGRRTYEYQYTGAAVQALIGLEFRVPRMSYFIEYKFTFADYTVPLSELDGTKIGLFADLYRQFRAWLSGNEPPGGTLKTRLTSHQVIGGLGVRFSTRPAAP